MKCTDCNQDAIYQCSMISFQAYCLDHAIEHLKRMPELLGEHKLSVIARAEKEVPKGLDKGWSFTT